MGTDPCPGRFTGTIHVSPAQLSQVVLGLIPGARAQAAMPACESIAGEPCRRNQAPVPAGTLNLP